MSNTCAIDYDITRDYKKIVDDLTIMQVDMTTLTEAIKIFSDRIFAPDYNHCYEDIVEASVTDIGVLTDYKLPMLLREESLFGKLNCLAVAHQLFRSEDISAIEAKLGRPLDEYDTVYVKRPKEQENKEDEAVAAVGQRMMVVRLKKGTNNNNVGYLLGLRGAARRCPYNCIQFVIGHRASLTCPLGPSVPITPDKGGESSAARLRPLARWTLINKDTWTLSVFSPPILVSAMDNNPASIQGTSKRLRRIV
uniref:Uncharacterized protein n=1 Tax=Heliothis virescens TaxID=7102 RepID=A0A2A4K206_HELVI